MKHKYINGVVLFLVFYMIGFASIQTTARYFHDGKEITKKKFITGNRNGKMVIFKNGIKMEEIVFLNGRRHGECSQWDADGWKKNIQEFSFGKKHGRWISWFANGMRRSETNFSDDLKHGQNLRWHENGQKELEGKYSQGKKDVRWLQWDSRGNLQVEEFWRKGRLTTKKDLETFVTTSYVYYAGGKKRYQREFKGGMKHGMWQKWDIGGSRIYVRKYMNGMKHGNWRVWDKGGAIISDEVWDKGKLVKKIR